MTSTDFILLLPLIVLSTATVAVMLGIAVRRNLLAALLLTLLGFAVTLMVLAVSPAGAPRNVTALFEFDDFARYFIGLIAGAGLFVAVLAFDYFRQQRGQHEEFFVLLLGATLGCATLVACAHFASLFLGLEILSVSLYAMIAYSRDRRISTEAGLKYLVLAGTSAAFLVFGMALVYAQTGALGFDSMPYIGSSPHAPLDIVVLAGYAMMIVGIGFKLAVVPFHLWTPDVYQGAPAPVTAFIATASKGAVFALLLRLFAQAELSPYSPLYVTFMVLSIGSMLLGSWLALLQDNVKRILAYSSIAHLGYLMVAFMGRGANQSTAAAFYLTAYFTTTLGAFGIVSLLSNGERDAERLEDYRGLFWRRPFMAVIFSVMMLSLAGIPLTGGFIGKVLVILAGEQAGQWALVVVLVAASAISLFYYLRVIGIMYMPVEPDGVDRLALPRLSLQGGGVLAFLAAFLVLLGAYPTPVLALIRDMVSTVYLGGVPQ